MPSTISSCWYVLAEEEVEGGGASLTVELVRHFFTVFRCWKAWPYFGVGIELLYLSDVELSHSITEW